MSQKFSFDWKKLQESITDAAKISGREIKRGVSEAKKQIEKVQLVQRRKELFAELGRNLYDAYEDGLPEEVEKYLKETELFEIILDLIETDDELRKLRKNGTDS